MELSFEEIEITVIFLLAISDILLSAGLSGEVFYDTKHEALTVLREAKTTESFKTGIRDLSCLAVKRLMTIQDLAFLVLLCANVEAENNKATKEMKLFFMIILLTIECLYFSPPLSSYFQSACFKS